MRVLVALAVAAGLAPVAAAVEPPDLEQPWCQTVYSTTVDVVACVKTRWTFSERGFIVGHVSVASSAGVTAEVPIRVP